MSIFALVAVGAGAEQMHFAANRQTALVTVDPATVKLQLSPINPAWIIEGAPTTMAAEIARTDDGTARAYVWQTTKARFHWYYAFDEVVSVLDGEVYVADEGGPERRLGPGAVAFFPAGARTTWRVPDHLRKIATVKRDLPLPFASLMRWGRTAKSWLGSTSAFAAE